MDSEGEIRTPSVPLPTHTDPAQGLSKHMPLCCWAGSPPPLSLFLPWWSPSLAPFSLSSLPIAIHHWGLVILCWGRGAAAAAGGGIPLFFLGHGFPVFGKTAFVDTFYGYVYVGRVGNGGRAVQGVGRSGDGDARDAVAVSFSLG